ncbi:hypothetical protein F5884DRAFT_852010 [Xylogone sp. PMI_703]|nr:hypothetical protein F5884DRAFT_852010 [Xylogone sp. PMI_703]
MPSRSNPNVPSKNRRIANRAKAQKKKAQSGIRKNTRGKAASSVLHPTSGPLAPVSAKKARKLERARHHARQRALEKEVEEREARGEGQMMDMDMEDGDGAKGGKKSAKEGKSKEVGEEGMDVDDVA